MTRINTNVSSIVAQNILGRSNAALQESLTRLSTGLRINTGKDDPAGLIASENLRSDITSIRRAISNTDRANQVIATADSALGQVSGLLNDIRGLVTEAANTGAMSPAQIAANQLQIDSSLEALNRIAQTTTFQGRRLLDGSLDFITQAGTGFNTVSDLKINKANLGSTGQVAVAVEITAAATQAQIEGTGVPAATAATAASGTVTFSVAAQNATGDADTAGFADNTVTGSLSIAGGSAFAGADGNDLTIVFAEDGGTATHAAALAGDVLTITVGTQGAGATIDLDTIFQALRDAPVAAFVDNITYVNGDVTGDYTVGTDDGGTATIAFSGGQDADAAATIDVTAVAGAAGNITLEFAEVASIGATPNVVDNGGGSYTIQIDDTVATSLSAIAAAIQSIAEVATATTASTASYHGADDTPAANETLAGGADATGGLDDDLVFEISGASGAEVLSFGTGTDVTTIVAAINQVSDVTGVSASDNGGVLELISDAYGSSAFVSVTILHGDSNETFAGGLDATRANGTDIVATVNGIAASGDGNNLTINTATLALGMAVAPGSSTSVNFTITGGGALFQLGPDVVSNQQARIGITSVNTARLGGVSGKLFQLAKGGAADLESDLNIAAKIVEEAMDQITSLRGRLGAFQRTTLETNRNALNDTMVNLTEAESLIRDADFAAETASLTRAQILVQSGTTVLAITNQNPQNVLALLR